MPVLTNTDPALRRGWHCVSPAAALGSGPVGFSLLGEAWVLWRGGGGLQAALDTCPHRRAPLSLGTVTTEGCLQCPYHGWRYDSQGMVTAIPALGPNAVLPPQARLKVAAGVAESAGMIWVAPETPLTPLPDVSDVDDLVCAPLPLLVTRAGAGLLADNFLDMAHFPFVHAATFGAEEATHVERYSVDRQDWSCTAVYEHLFANREDPGVTNGERPLIQTRRMTYRYQAPFALTLHLDYLATGVRNVIGFFIQPETEDMCRIHTMLWRNDLGDDPERIDALVAFEVAVVNEDLRLQERFADLSLPLDLTDEVHTRADRLTVELRRVLADLVSATSPPLPTFPHLEGVP